MYYKITIIIILILLSKGFLFANNDLNIKNLMIKSKEILGDKGTIIFINTQNGMIEGIVNEKLAFSKAVAPGSTFKLITALASLKKDINNSSFKTYCTDRFYIIAKGIKNNRINFKVSKATIGNYFRCSQIGGHKSIDFFEAIRKSCNFYFFTLGDKIGYNLFYNTMNDFGFGKKVFKNLDTETTGYLKKENSQIKKLLSYIGDSRGIYITPIQMALFINYLATDGKILILKLKINNKLLISRKLKENENYKHILSIAKKGLIKKVSTGTDFYKNNYFYESFAGKTGSATIETSNATSGWFVGYAPIEQPKLSFVLYLENGNGKKALKKIEKIIFNKIK